MPSQLTSVSVSGNGFSQMVAAVREVYSREIWFNAMPNLRFLDYATQKTELSAQPGQTIVMPKAGPIRRGGTLTEGVRINAQAMSLSTISITVNEKGNAIGMTERALNQSFFDQMSMAALHLGRDCAETLDRELRDTVAGAVNTIIANQKVSRAAITAADVLGTGDLYRATELLETLNAPKWFNDYYVAFIHPHQLSSIRQAPGWINAQLYAGVQRIFSGEAGRWNDVRFISTSMCPNGKDSTLNAAGESADPGYNAALATGAGGNLTTIYQAFLFGEFSYAHAVGLPVELRDNGVQDYGREHGLAWYAIWGSGLLETRNSAIIETA